MPGHRRCSFVPPCPESYVISFGLCGPNVEVIRLADRVVKVTLQAVIANYVSGMEKARKATSDAADEATKLEKLRDASDKVGAGFLTFGAAAVAAVGLVVKSAADFDAQMSKVQAATGASAAEMDKFRNQALTAGAQFGYTAEQVTEAQIELGKAGVSTNDIMSGLSGVLGLAASDNLELGTATQIAAVAMTQFGKSGSDITHIADLLAAGAGKALGGVDQLGQALNQSGQVANQFGLSIEDTVGTLSAFAGAGLLGSDAGTSFKTMLQSLANPAKQTKELMADLGLNFYNANGEFVGITAAAQELQDKLGGLTDQQRQAALAQIFGSDAVRAASVLYEEGATGIQSWIDKVDDSGYAMEQARLKSDNLNGDLKKLQSAFQSGLIEAGSSADGALRPLVQTLTNVVTAVNGLPEPLKGVGLGATAVVGGVSLLAGGLLLAIPRIVEFRAALATLREGGITARSSLNSVTKFMTGPWGIALSVAAAAAAVFAAQQLQSAQYTQTLRDSLDATTGALTKNTSELVSNALAARTTIFGAEVSGSSAFDKAKRLGISLETVTQAAQGNTKAYRELKRAQDEIRSSSDNEAITKKYGQGLSAASGDITELVQAVDKQREAVRNSKGQFDQLAEAQGDSAGASEDAAAGLGQVAQSAEDATQAITDTANAIKGFNSAQLDVNSSQRDFEAAIDAVSDSVKENGQSLDVTTEKGRANAATLDSIAQSTLNYAGALYQQTGSQDDATQALNAGRESLIAALGQYGVTGQAAQDYANKILGTPESWSTLFIAETDDANSKADEVKRRADEATQKRIAVVQGDVADALAKIDETKKRLASVPPSKRTQVQAEVAQAQANLLAVLRTLNSLQSKTLTVTTRNVRINESINAGAAPGAAKAAYATGGHVRGAGSATSDSIPAWLSNGEYVVKASSVRKYGTGMLDHINAGRYATGGLVASATEANTRAKNEFKHAQDVQRKLQSVFDKSKTADNRARLVAAQADTAAARRAVQQATAALQRAKDAPKGADLGDRLSFRSAVRDGSFDAQAGVRDLYAMGQDSAKYSARQRTSFLNAANKNELAMLKLQKQSEKAAGAVEKASDKLGDLKSSAASMASSVSGKLSDVSYGNYRSGSSLLRGLTNRAGKLKQFQSLLSTLQKNGIAPALLNEVASLGVDEGLPLARSLASMSKGQLSAINSQYNSIGKTSTAIGGQVADANYKTLIASAEKQLSAANKNADKITAAINAQAKRLEKVIGRALGLPGYSAGGYTGNGGLGQVAGFVHGREFVSNAASTARNRAVLEAMNNGATVRYMDATRVVAAAPAASPQFTQQLNVQPMQHVDPNTMLTVLGREAARQFAGMVS